MPRNSVPRLLPLWPAAVQSFWSAHTTRLATGGRFGRSTFRFFQPEPQLARAV
jgi:hypothetical protein